MNIMAIGGGEIRNGETMPFDVELVRLSGRRNPHVLFLPTASSDNQEKAVAVSNAFGSMGCGVETLWLLGQDANTAAAHEKILRADLIYVGGGNSKLMVDVWRQLGVDSMLKKHIAAGKPVGGVSAGAICWFRVGNSDWPQFEGVYDVNTAPLLCLGFVDLAICPHTSSEPFRLPEFREMMREIPGVGVGIDDCCALQIKSEEYRVLSSKPGAVCHRVEWKNGELLERIMEPHEDFRPLAELRRG